jgi:putative transposase
MARVRLKVACELAGIDVRTLQRWNLEPQPRICSAATGVHTPCVRAHGFQRARIRIGPAALSYHSVSATEAEPFSRVLRGRRGMFRCAVEVGRKRPQRPRGQPGRDSCGVGSDIPRPSPPLVSGFIYDLILDVYSRKIVGFEVQQNDNSDHVVDLLAKRLWPKASMPCGRKPFCTATKEVAGLPSRATAALLWLPID